jgi:hypothetical protein
VEVLSILAKVKNAKKGNFYPNCINGITTAQKWSQNILHFHHFSLPFNTGAVHGKLTEGQLEDAIKTNDAN